MNVLELRTMLENQIDTREVLVLVDSLIWAIDRVDITENGSVLIRLDWDKGPR